MEAVGNIPGWNLKSKKTGYQFDGIVSPLNLNAGIIGLRPGPQRIRVIRLFQHTFVSAHFSGLFTYFGLIEQVISKKKYSPASIYLWADFLQLDNQWVSHLSAHNSLGNRAIYLSLLFCHCENMYLTK